MANVKGIYRMGNATVVTAEDNVGRIFFVYENFNKKNEILWAKVRDFGNDVAWNTAKAAANLINSKVVEQRNTTRKGEQLEMRF